MHSANRGGRETKVSFGVALSAVLMTTYQVKILVVIVVEYNLQTNKRESLRM